MAWSLHYTCVTQQRLAHAFTAFCCKSSSLHEFGSIVFRATRREGTQLWTPPTRFRDESRLAPAMRFVLYRYAGETGRLTVIPELAASAGVPEQPLD